MGNYELIEELCSVARLQADIIQKQAEAIAQAEIAESVAADLAEMRKQGAWTLGQDEESSVVYGMPRVAFELGAVQKQVPLEKMAEEISKIVREHSK